jgi:hypothetical protein
MNEWTRKSIEKANSPGYLDELQEVYPVAQEAQREVDQTVIEALKQIYDGGDDLALIKQLLKLEKFPIKDPYVAFLRKNERFLQYNPQTVKRIAERIRSMGFEAMIKSVEEPKEFNRQIGTLFSKWIQGIGYPILPENKLTAYNEGIALLEGGDRQLMEFANEILGCKLNKGLDFLAKVGETYVIGEAKFLTEYGGHQDRQLEDALRLLEGTEGDAVRVAVLDGVVWIKSRAKMHKQIRGLKLKDRYTALSALLLKDFLQSLLQSSR